MLESIPLLAPNQFPVNFPPEPVNWLPDGSPHSPRFNDRYRSLTGGLAQADTVFLQGCGLPDGWRCRSDFSILETGFGLGLNFLATWASWEADEHRSNRLHFCSLERYPVAARDIVRNISAGQEFARVTDQKAQRLQAMALELAQRWEMLHPGIQALEFAGGRVQLKLAFGEVLTSLKALECSADAVYLDGFSPAVNPEMWSGATLGAVTAHCNPGTRLATYTVAKSVRQRLKDLGFEVKKCPGLPPKRDRLEAVLLPSL